MMLPVCKVLKAACHCAHVPMTGGFLLLDTILGIQFLEIFTEYPNLMRVTKCVCKCICYLYVS